MEHLQRIMSETKSIKVSTYEGDDTFLGNLTFRQVVKFWFLKFSCPHRWHLHFASDVFGSEHRSPIAVNHTLICKRCGKIKTMTV